jgi:hypothetical protein
MKINQDNDLLMSVVMRALSTKPEEREAYVSAACGGDSELLALVRDYVRAEQEMAGFLERPALEGFPWSFPEFDETETAFEPGEMLADRFRIIRRVAEGGMGVVYEARDERLCRPVALKCAKAGFGRRLPPEARHASAISHPNVCRIFEIHTAKTARGDVDFLTMEFLDGETLAERLRRGTPARTEVNSIADQLCAGLAEAHRNHVIHGDLKSNNVILTRGPEGALRAVITDFGLANLGAGALPGAQGMASAPVGGAAAYMAPELKKGAKPSAASDVYALGVMLSGIPGEVARDSGALPAGGPGASIRGRDGAAAGGAAFPDAALGGGCPCGRFAGRAALGNYYLRASGSSEADGAAGADAV